MRNAMNSDEILANVDLFNQIEKHALLYDKNHEDFADQEKKTEAWKEISNKVGRSVEACEKTYRTLRDVYARELKKIRHSNGVAVEVSWPYMDAMKFLNPHIVHKGQSKGSFSSPIAITPAGSSAASKKKKSPISVNSKSTNASKHRSVSPQPASTKKKPTKNSKPTSKPKKTATQPTSKPKKTTTQPNPPKKSIENEEPALTNGDNFIVDEADSIRGDTDSDREGDNTIRQEADVVNNHEMETPKRSEHGVTSEVPQQIKLIVDSLQELLMNSVGTSNEPRDDAYYFGMTVACKLRQMTRKNRSIAQAEIQYRLRQIELENDFS